MKREDRFLGNGNTWLANSQHRGWQVTCASCGVTKLVTSHRRGALPNEVVLKKFLQAGWSIGLKSADDLCGSCQHQRPVKFKPAPNGHDKPAPALPLPPRRLPPFTNAAEYFEQLRVLIADLKGAIKDRRNNLILGFFDQLEERLDHTVTDHLTIKPAPLVEAKPVEDTDYDKWLAELGMQNAE